MILQKNFKKFRSAYSNKQNCSFTSSHIPSLTTHLSSPTSHFSGITLVALVVTIVVLLILAGVTITALIGDDGIISKANVAAQLTKKAVTIESVQTDILLAQLEGSVTQDKLEEILGKYGEVQKDEEGNISGLKVDGLDEIIPIEDLYEGNIEEITDTTAPTASIDLAATSTTPGTAINATVTFTDNESGINTAGCKYVYNTTSGTYGIDNEIWNTAQTFSSNPQTINLTGSTEGTYYLHVLVVDNAGNKGEAVSSAVTVEEEGLSAQDIATAVASNPSAYYGKTVTNYECTNASANSAVANWKIFYAGNDFSEDGNTYHVYLIADNYIPRANIPASTAGHSLNAGSYPRTAYFTNILNDYSGSSSIANNVKNLNKDFFTKKYSSANNNMRAVAYMLDTNVWSVYTGAGAEYAVGGPSIEMVMESYSQVHDVNYQAQASSATGYRISTDGGSNWKDCMTTTSSSEYLSTSDSLYVISSNSNAYGYWVASPSTGNTGTVMCVDFRGRVSFYDYFYDAFRCPPPSLSKL